MRYGMRCLSLRISTMGQYREGLLRASFSEYIVYDSG